MPKICGIATKTSTISAFMIPNMNYMSEHGWSCYSICNGSIDSDELKMIVHIPMNIKWGYVGPIEAVRNIVRFYRIFKKEKFDVIQYATFNAAFPASIAGWLAHVPVRINLQWGMSYISAKGFEHYFKRAVEKITCWCSTSVQPDSFGNLKLSIEDGLYPASKGCVIYNGSATGVDLDKYNYSKREEWRKDLFEKYNLYRYKRVFGFVGRVLKDKGVDELLEAFMSMNNDDTFLLVIGSLHATDSLKQDVYQKAQRQKNIVFTGPVPSAAKYYAAMDFLILPSYHEGFGMTVVESAGVGTPAIITDIKGPTDLIKNGVNGIVCDVKSASSLETALRKAVDMTTDEYNIMADTAYNIAKTDFDSDTYKVKYFENRKSLLEQALEKK